MIQKTIHSKQSEVEILRQLTLIIPTFNRPVFLSRLLAYYGSKKVPIKFLILDSSDEGSKEINKQATNILGDQARYVAFPSTTLVASKLLEGLKLVETPFSAFCADDDLVFIEGLISALTFLQNNQEYVCADGIYLNFHIVENNINLTIEYATQGINAENSMARIFRLCQKYESLFYGVFETKNILKIFSGVCKNSSLHYQELFQSVAALLMGKSYRLPIFYGARQHCEAAEQSREKWQTYYWFGENSKEFISHYVVYREELWNFYDNLGVKQKYVKEVFFQIMDVIHAMYFGVGCPPEYFHSVLQSEWPNDPFQKEDILVQNGIYNQLKKRHRIQGEILIQKITKWLPKAFSALYSVWDLNTLNHEIKKRTSGNWNCKLNTEFRWLVSVDVFRNAYEELCTYMESTSKVSK